MPIFDNESGIGASGSEGSSPKVVADDFSSLPAGVEAGDLAYVKSSQGAAWLPGALGGAYYPKGWYLWDGSIWVSDRNSIAQAISNSGSGSIYSASSIAKDQDELYLYSAWERTDGSGYIAQRYRIGGSSAGTATGMLPIPVDIKTLTYP